MPPSCRSEQRGVDADASLPTQFSSYKKVGASDELLANPFESARMGSSILGSSGPSNRHQSRIHKLIRLEVYEQNCFLRRLYFY